MHTHAKHTHSPLCSFFLQLFISPWHFEARSCLCVSLLPNPDFSFICLLLYFMRFCFPSSFLPVCLIFSLSFHTRVGYQMFHHVTVNKVKCSTPFLHFFFFLLLLHQRSWFYLLFPACNLAVTPNPSLQLLVFFLCFHIDLTSMGIWVLISSDSFEA